MEKRQIKTCNKISGKGLSLFPDGVYHVSDEAENPAAIILRSKKLTSDDLNQELLAIGRAGAGTDNIPVEECTKRGIVVFNAPGANANAVSELTIAALLVATRNIIPAVKALENLPRTPNLGSDAEKIKSGFAGYEVKGKTMGIVGLGNIGTLVAQTADALGIKVIGYDPMLPLEKKQNLPRHIEYTETLDTLSECDFVSFHVALNDATREMINEDLLDKMKKGVVVLNFSRGGLVNVEGLMSALISKQVSTYITDFTHPDLAGLPNVLAFPHLGASTAEAEENCARMACSQVKHFLEEGVVTNSVNFPNLALEPSSYKRIFVVYEDKPGMIGKIHDVFGQQNINIVRSTNGSRKNICGAALLDVDFKGELTCINELAQAEGIVSYRLIK